MNLSILFLPSCLSNQHLPILADSSTPTKSIAVSPAPTLFTSPTQVSWVVGAPNKVCPDNVLQEVDYFGGGGGGGPLGPVCSHAESPRLSDLDLTQSNLENGQIFIITCGWAIDETVTIRVKRPDGKEIVRSQKALSQETYLGYEPDIGILFFEVYVGVNDPEGRASSYRPVLNATG